MTAPLAAPRHAARWRPPLLWPRRSWAPAAAGGGTATATSAVLSGGQSATCCHYQLPPVGGGPQRLDAERLPSEAPVAAVAVGGLAKRSKTGEELGWGQGGGGRGRGASGGGRGRQTDREKRAGGGGDWKGAETT